MVVDFDERDGCLIIRPRFSRLDALVAQVFREEVVGKVSQHAVVVLDLNDVESMDSTGLGTIISILKRMRPGTNLRLARLSPAVRVLLELTRLDRVLRIFVDVDAAVAK